MLSMFQTLYLHFHSGTAGLPLVSARGWQDYQNLVSGNFN